jgi:hypothetical protein
MTHRGCCADGWSTDMSAERVTPFDNIESAYEYVSLLREALDEAYASIQDETAVAQSAEATRRIDAFRLVEYKLNKLRQHLLASQVLLNDLRTLRRLLLQERDSDATEPADGA